MKCSFCPEKRQHHWGLGQNELWIAAFG